MIATPETQYPEHQHKGGATQQPNIDHQTPEHQSKEQNIMGSPPNKNQNAKAWHLTPEELRKKREKQRKARTIIFLDKQKRPTTISTKSGYRTLNILSLNPDNFISTTRQDDITHELQKQRIHLAAIQETHIPHDLSYKRNGYRGITTAARKLTARTSTHVCIKAEFQSLYMRNYNTI